MTFTDWERLAFVFLIYYLILNWNKVLKTANFCRIPFLSPWLKSFVPFNTLEALNKNSPKKLLKSRFKIA